MAFQIVKFKPTIPQVKVVKILSFFTDNVSQNAKSNNLFPCTTGAVGEIFDLFSWIMFYKKQN